MEEQERQQDDSPNNTLPLGTNFKKHQLDRAEQQPFDWTSRKGSIKEEGKETKPHSFFRITGLSNK